MADLILERILREAGIPDLVDVLAERLAPGDLQSLLLEVYRRRAAALEPRDVAAQYARSRFVRPSAVDPRVFLALDRLIFGLLPSGWEPLEPAPLVPLGTSSAIASLAQQRVVSTARNSEVLSDSTNLLALECAARRRDLLRATPGSTERVRLCASARVLRAQQFSGPHSVAHFRLLGLCSAGRDEGDWRFESSSLVEQVDLHLSVLAGARTLGSTLAAPRVELGDLAGGRHTSHLERDVLQPLARAHPDVELALDPERERARGYYTGAAFEIRARDPGGEELSLVDGGFTDWTQRLLSDRKERLLISGLGLERLATHLPRA